MFRNVRRRRGSTVSPSARMTDRLWRRSGRDHRHRSRALADKKACAASSVGWSMWIAKPVSMPMSFSPADNQAVKEPLMIRKRQWRQHIGRHGTGTRLTARPGQAVHSSDNRHAIREASRDRRSLILPLPEQSRPSTVAFRCRNGTDVSPRQAEGRSMSCGQFSAIAAGIALRRQTVNSFRRSMTGSIRNPAQLRGFFMDSTGRCAII